MIYCSKKFRHSFA